MLTDATEPALRMLCYLASWSHDLGALLAQSASADYPQGYLEHVALLELAARADACPIDHKNPRVRAIWCANYVRGWSTTSIGDEQPPTLDIGDYRPHPTPFPW